MKRLIRASVPIIVICIVLLVYACEKSMSPKERQLYTAIESGNYQGVCEALEDTSDIDLENIGISEETLFSVRDHRALGLSMSSGTSNADRISALLIEAGADVNSVLDNGTTYLMEASPELTELLINAGADVLKEDENGYTVLDYIVGSYCSNKKTVVQKEINLLLEKGARPNEKTLEMSLNNAQGYDFTEEVLDWVKQYNGTTGISKGLESAVYGNEEKLLEEIENNNIPDKEKEAVSFYAAKNCSLRVLKEMKKRGFDFNIRDEFDQTPLDIAAQYNDRNVLQFLSDCGNSVDNIDEEENTSMAMSPILYALIGGNESNVQFFLEKGIELPTSEYRSLWGVVFGYGNPDSISILESNSDTPDTYELYAAFVNSSERQDGNEDRMFNYLLEHYEVQGLKDEMGVSVLAGIAEVSSKYCRKLLSLGVEVDTFAITNAIQRGDAELAKALIENCKDVNQSVEKEESPLIAAIYCGEFDLVKLLIQKGADVNMLIRNEDGQAEAPIHIAAYSPSEKILTYLIQNGADVNLKTSAGKSAFDLAKEADLEGNLKIIEGDL